MRVAPGAATPEDGLRLTIRTCVAHRMARPRLALLLDREESRLQLADTLGSVAEDVTAALPAEPGTAAGDLFALVRGMVDATGERGERNREDLERHVLRAVHGYIGVPQAVA